MVNSIVHIISTYDVEKYTLLKYEDLPKETGISDLPVSDNCIIIGSKPSGIHGIVMRSKESVCRGNADSTEEFQSAIEDVIGICLSGGEGSFQPPHILITQPQYVDKISKECSKYGLDVVRHELTE